MQAPNARRSLSAWRTLQGRLVLSLIFCFSNVCFSYLGQKKCKTWQQPDQAGLWPGACRPANPKPCCSVVCRWEDQISREN